MSDLFFTNTSVSLPLLGGAVVFVTVCLFQALYSSILRPRWYLRNLPGPPHESYLAGHMNLVDAKPAGVQHAEWNKRYGSMIAYDGYMKIPRISIFDEAAMRYVLGTETYNFPKPMYMRRLLGQVFGLGIVVAEGSDHARQRKIMNPAMGPSHVRKTYPVVLEKTRKLCTILRQKISDNPSGESAQIDVLRYTTRVSLDISSAAALGYDTNTLAEGSASPLESAFLTLANSIENFDIWHAAVNYFPFLRILDRSERAKATKYAVDVLGDIGARLVSERQGLVAQTGTNELPAISRDLLGALVRANQQQNVQSNAKLSDLELRSQIGTALLAGSDTTAAALVWAMFALSNDPDIQRVLREEISTIADDEPTVDQLNALKYLDAVIRESLRLHPPISCVLRTAAEDTMVPLSQPIVGRDGRTQEGIFVARGTDMFIPIASFNRREDAWGADASKFNPDRFIEGRVPLGATQLPSAAFPTFIAGPRVCIGFRFALLEMKTVIFHLIRSFEFLPVVSPDEVLAQATFVTRPKLHTRPQEGYELPMCIRAV